MPRHVKLCNYCREPYEAVRKDSQFCGDSCKMKNHRRNLRKAFDEIITAFDNGKLNRQMLLAIRDPIVGITTKAPKERSPIKLNEAHRKVLRIIKDAGFYRPSQHTAQMCTRACELFDMGLVSRQREGRYTIYRLV